MIAMKDVVQIVESTANGYGDKTTSVITDVDSLFLQSTGSSHANNTDIVNSDAHVYLDVDNTVLKERGYRIEGMYVIANPFGAADDKSWYRITKVVVGQRKLLDNDVDNVHAFLRKVAPLSQPHVS